jgi:hypothetical protein
MICERNIEMLGAKGRTDVFKPATKTDQALVFYLFFTALSF